MFKNILVPLDGSPVGEAALPYARALAGRTNATLTLVRDAHAGFAPGDRGGDQLRAISAAEDYLAAHARGLAAYGFSVETGVPFAGSPAAWIAEEVSIRHADLIVMATHDRSGPDRWLHGSVAEAVVSRAHVPVLLIRATEDVRPVERFDVPRPELVVPLDGSPLAEAALPLARDLASTIGGHLVLVSVIPTPGQLVAQQRGAITTYVGSDHARLAADAKEYLDEIVSQLTAGGLSAEGILCEGKPAGQIDEVARERDAAAVVMATHGRTGLFRAMVGSVAGEVLHLGSSPVMLVRPRDLRPAEEPVRVQATSAAPA